MHMYMYSYAHSTSSLYLFFPLKYTLLSSLWVVMVSWGPRRLLISVEDASDLVPTAMCVPGP